MLFVMNRYFYIFIIVVGIVLHSCSCDNSGKVNTEKKFADSTTVNVVVNDEKVDSDTIDESSMVNVYEVVEDSESRTANHNSSTVAVSKRGETNNEKINEEFSLQGNGIGVVRIGADITKLPNKDKGLYDKKKMEGGELLFYKGKEVILEVAYDKKSNLINSIRVTSASIKTEDGICQFMNYNALMKNEKAKKAIGNKTKYNLDSFNINGITYEMEECIEGDKYVSAIIIK